MIEAVLYIVAGFFAALFLTMAVAPLVWRRAGYLMRKRIEAAVPLSVNELQADKDRVRAESAVRESQLGRTMAKQREKLTGQATRIVQLNDDIAALKATVADRDGTIAAMEQAKAQSAEEVQKGAGEIGMLRAELGTIEAALAARTGELESMTRLRTDAQNHLARMEVSLEENRRITQSLETRLGKALEKRRHQQAEQRRQRTEASRSSEMLQAERSRLEDLNRRHEKAVARISMLEDQSLRRDAELERLREDRRDKGDGLAELERRAEDSEHDRRALEEEVAAMTVRLGGIEKLFGDTDPETALASRDARIAALEGQLSAAATASGEGAGDDALREAIADQAARLVHMATVLEGQGSPVPALIASAGERPGARSLADRIRALQRRAGMLPGDGEPDDERAAPAGAVLP